ncbi:Putative lysophospholipase [Elusimicrobium minutum Pei191]|uniref:Putative lysophospholipase n=1 Tax=Elusimicrobium minutum (strain Pei191) TaxID=445932 RepID=B2KEX9_ELUMP|nr:alpha/beta fold hydrolase [Elusimicrobium minutum]ACC99075.1 Putative lysophospholipase [Elusimicrobium minutum Pei191]
MKKIFNIIFLLCLLQTSVLAQTTEGEETPAPPPPDAVESVRIEGERVNITADDGQKITGIFKSSGDSSKYVVLVHDLGKNKSSFNKFSKALLSRGVGYLAIDLRGHGQSASPEHYSHFQKEGINNQFNRMYKDINIAVTYLKNRRIDPENIFVLGTGLGANVTANSIVFNTDIGGFALITPTTNVRDVLTIPGVKIAKQPILIAVAPDVRKNFLESSLIRNVAFNTQGPGKVTFLTAYNKEGVEMMDSYLSGHIIQWILTPVLPEIKNDSLPIINEEEQPTELTL